MTTTERPTMPAIECTPWCVDGDGHTDAFVREDQTCWGPKAYVELSLEPIERDSQAVWVPRIGAQAYRHWPAEVPCVYVHLSGRSTVVGNRYPVGIWLGPCSGSSEQRSTVGCHRGQQVSRDCKNY